MNFLNLDIKTLRSHELLGSEPVDRATWLTLLTYCVIQENGGAIENCREWGDRKWMQLVGITKAEIERVCDLWTWDGSALEIFAYPMGQERTILQKRKMGKKFAKKRWGEPRSKNGTPNGSPIEEPNTERKGIGKEEEGKGIGNTPIVPAPPVNGSSHSLGEGEKKKTPTTPEAQRIHALFNRRDSTGWAPKEIATYKGLVKRGVATSEHIDLLERYYAAERTKGSEGRHRRDLSTFLNNFDGEIDRARAFAEGAPAASTARNTSDDGYTDCDA